MIKCKYCNKRFINIDDLAKHYEEEHLIRHPYAHAIATFAKAGEIHTYTEEMKEYDKTVSRKWEEKLKVLHENQEGKENATQE